MTSENQTALAAQVDAVFANLDIEPDVLDEFPEAESTAEKLDEEGEWRFKLDSSLTPLITQLASEKMRKLADTDPSELRPQLYREDPVAEAEWQMRGDQTLYELQISDLKELIEFLEGEQMSLERCEACVRALTDLRIELFNQHGDEITDSPVADLYHLLVWLTATLVELL